LVHLWLEFPWRINLIISKIIPSFVIILAGALLFLPVSFGSNAFAQTDTTQSQIPDWIKTNAEWWANGLVSDADFVRGLEYMVENGIITSPTLEVVKIAEDEAVGSTEVMPLQEIPDWIKTNAEWWASGAIGDADFVRGIEFMIKEKIITTSKIKVVEKSSPNLVEDSAPVAEEFVGIGDGLEVSVSTSEEESSISESSDIDSDILSADSRAREFQINFMHKLGLQIILDIKNYEVELLADTANDAWRQYAFTNDLELEKYATIIDQEEINTRDDILKISTDFFATERLANDAEFALRGTGLGGSPIKEIAKVIEDKFQKIKIDSKESLDSAYLQAVEIKNTATALREESGNKRILVPTSFKMLDEGIPDYVETAFKLIEAKYVIADFGKSTQTESDTESQQTDQLLTSDFGSITVSENEITLPQIGTTKEVIISGTANNYKTASVIELKIIKPLEDTDRNRLYADDAGNFDFKLYFDFDGVPGTYTAIAKYNNKDLGTISFTVKEFAAQETSESIAEVEKQSFVKLSGEKLTVTPTYQRTQELQITGLVDGYGRGQTVQIILVNPDGSTNDLNLYCAKSGEFSSLLSIDYDSEPRTYKIIAEYRSDEIASITFLAEGNQITTITDETNVL